MDYGEQLIGTGYASYLVLFVTAALEPQSYKREDEIANQAYNDEIVLLASCVILTARPARSA